MSVVSVRVSTRGESSEERVSHVMGEEILQFPGQFMEHTSQLARDLLGTDHVRITYMDSEGDACTLTEETVKDALCFTTPGSHEEQPRVLELEVSPKEEMQAPPLSTSSEVQDGQAADTSETQSRANLVCASPSCSFRVHSNPKFGAYCCNACKKSPGIHGPCCQQTPAPEGATRASSEMQSPTKRGCCSDKKTRHGKRHWSYHQSVVCDGCGQNPITGSRYQSQEWNDYDLCGECHDRSDRAEVLGVLPDHKFNVIEPIAANPTAWVDGLLDRMEQDPTAFFQQWMPMVNVQEMLPKFAEVGLEVVASMDKEELFPLLDPLTTLAEQNPLDMQSLPAQLRAIVTIVRAAPQQIQDELKQRCMAGGMRLFCSGGASGFGPFHHPGWLKGMFKGMFKGKGKGMCKGESEGPSEHAKGWGKGHHWSKGWGKACRAAWKGKGLGKGMCPRSAHWGQRQTGAPGTHQGITCDGCEQSPIVGMRYRSQEWRDYDLCQTCHDSIDQRSLLGVAPEHSFEAIPPAEVSEASETPPLCALAQNLAPFLPFLMSFGVDLRQVVPKLASAGLEVVQDMGKEELFPMLDPLTTLVQQENPDIHSLAGPAATIFETVKAAPPPVQHELMMLFAGKAQAVLGEVSPEAAALVQTLLAKGKGKGKRGKGWGKCGKGWGKRSWCEDGESQNWFGGCAKRARHDDENTSAVHDAALSSLLAHPDEKIREAAQQALQQAASASANASTQPTTDDVGQPYTAPVTAPAPYIESAVPSDPPREVSAVLSSEPAVEIHSGAISLAPLESRDITDEWQPLLSQFASMKQAFLLGRVFMDAAASQPGVVTIHFGLGNDGTVSWPANTSLRIAAGNPLGCEQVEAGEVPVGSVLEVTLKLDLPVGIDANRSAWALESNGEPFGPMLILEVLRS